MTLIQRRNNVVCSVGSCKIELYLDQIIQVEVKLYKQLGLQISKLASKHTVFYFSYIGPIYQLTRNMAMHT